MTTEKIVQEVMDKYARDNETSQVYDANDLLAAFEEMKEKYDSQAEKLKGQIELESEVLGKCELLNELIEYLKNKV